MSEPFSSFLLSKAASLAVDKIAATLDRSADMVLHALERVENDLQILRNAYIDDALDCLREGDLPAYRRAAREAKNRNKFNVYARLLYIDALVRERQHRAAAEAILECIEWYGFGCPLLPPDIRRAGGSLSTIKLRGTPGLSNILECGFGLGNTFQMVGVSRAGVVAAWQYSFGFFGRSHATTILFQPWVAAGQQSEERIFTGEGASQRPIYWLTDRLLLHPFSPDGGFEVVDLHNTSSRQIFTLAQARQTFGDMVPPVGRNASGQLRGIKIEISERLVHERSTGAWGPGDSRTVTKLVLTPMHVSHD